MTSEQPAEFVRWPDDAKILDADDMQWMAAALAGPRPAVSAVMTMPPPRADCLGRPSPIACSACSQRQVRESASQR